VQSVPSATSRCAACAGIGMLNSTAIRKYFTVHPPPFKFFILAKVIVRKKGQQALPKFPFPVDFMKPATIFGLSDAEEKIDT
jgi:hypothetical protein